MLEKRELRNCSPSLVTQLLGVGKKRKGFPGAERYTEEYESASLKTLLKAVHSRGDQKVRKQCEYKIQKLGLGDRGQPCPVL